MTESKPTTHARIAPAGLMFLAITSAGWGINWPINKYLLSAGLQMARNVRISAGIDHALTPFTRQPVHRRPSTRGRKAAGS